MSVPQNQLMRDPEVANKLNLPRQTVQQLGHRRETWCEFHQIHGHNTKNYYVTTVQLTRLAGDDALQRYLQALGERKQATPLGSVAPREPTHEVPILGDFNTMAGGFPGEGVISSTSDQYYHWKLKDYHKLFPFVSR